MKKYTIITLALVAIIGIAPIVKAEEGSSSNSGSSKKWPFAEKKEVRERMDDRREKEIFEKRMDAGLKIAPTEMTDARRMERLKEIREQKLPALTEGENKGNKFGHMKQIAKKAHMLNFRLENLMSRFQARIDKIASKGVDVSKAETQMTVVEASIVNAKTKIEALKALEPVEGTSEDTGAIETARNGSKEAIKTVHEEMKELITILKTYKVSDDSTKSTESASTNTE